MKSYVKANKKNSRGENIFEEVTTTTSTNKVSLEQKTRERDELQARIDEINLQIAEMTKLS